LLEDTTQWLNIYLKNQYTIDMT